MKKHIPIVIALLFSFNVSAQDLETRIADEICECFIGAEDSDLDPFRNCIGAKIQKYESELKTLIDPNSEMSEYEQGVEIGKRIMFDSQDYLVNNCDKYYDYFLNLRSESIEEMKLTYVLSKLEALNASIAENRDIDQIWDRGNYYFANDDLDNAEKNYQECLSIDPDYFQASFFLAWLNERKGNYKKAIALYEYVLEKANMQEVTIYLALAKRVAREN